MAKRNKLIIIIILVIILLNSELIYCEIMTAMHINDFDSLQNPMIGNINLSKILKYNNKEAVVYYVSDDYSLGQKITFNKKDNGEWEEVNYNTVWSSSGSADDFVFPYFWHTLKYVYFRGF